MLGRGSRVTRERGKGGASSLSESDLTQIVYLLLPQGHSGPITGLPTLEGGAPNPPGWWLSFNPCAIEPGLFNRGPRDVRQAKPGKEEALSSIDRR